MPSPITIYTQTDKRDWLATGYTNQGKITAYDQSVYTPDKKFVCEIPYKTTDLNQALVSCDQQADAYTPPAVDESGAEQGALDSKSSYEMQYDMFLFNYRNVARRISSWLNMSSFQQEGKDKVYYNPSCSASTMNREQGLCSYVVDSDSTRPGMEQIYLTNSDNHNHGAILLTGGKRSSVIDLINGNI